MTVTLVKARATLWERLVGLSQPVCLFPGSNKLHENRSKKHGNGTHTSQRLCSRNQIVQPCTRLYTPLSSVRTQVAKPIDELRTTATFEPPIGMTNRSALLVNFHSSRDTYRGTTKTQMKNRKEHQHMQMKE